MPPGLVASSLFQELCDEEPSQQGAGGQAAAAAGAMKHTPPEDADGGAAAGGGKMLADALQQINAGGRSATPDPDMSGWSEDALADALGDVRQAASDDAAQIATNLQLWREKVRNQSATQHPRLKRAIHALLAKQELLRRAARGDSFVMAARQRPQAQQQAAAPPQTLQQQNASEMLAFQNQAMNTLLLQQHARNSGPGASAKLPRGSNSARQAQGADAQQVHAAQQPRGAVYTPLPLTLAPTAPLYPTGAALPRDGGASGACLLWQRLAMVQRTCSPPPAPSISLQHRRRCLARACCL
jgi:hypothetical protein